MNVFMLISMETGSYSSSLFSYYTRGEGSLSRSTALANCSGRMGEGVLLPLRRDLAKGLLSLVKSFVYHGLMSLFLEDTIGELSSASGSKEALLFKESSTGSFRGSAGPGGGVLSS